MPQREHFLNTLASCSNFRFWLISKLTVCNNVTFAVCTISTYWYTKVALIFDYGHWIWKQSVPIAFALNLFNGIHQCTRPTSIKRNFLSGQAWRIYQQPSHCHNPQPTKCHVQFEFVLQNHLFIVLLSCSFLG